MAMQLGFAELSVTGGVEYHTLALTRADAFEEIQSQFHDSGIAKMSSVYANRKPKKRRFCRDGIEISIES